MLYPVRLSDHVAHRNVGVRQPTGIGTHSGTHSAGGLWRRRLGGWHLELGPGCGGVAKCPPRAPNDENRDCRWLYHFHRSDSLDLVTYGITDSWSTTWGKPGRKLRSFPACGGEAEGHEGEGGGGVTDPESDQHRLRQQGRLEGGEAHQEFREAGGGGMERCHGSTGAVRDQAGVIRQGDHVEGVEIEQREEGHTGGRHEAPGGARQEG